MKSSINYYLLLLLLFLSTSVYSQTLDEAKALYLNNEFAKALPVFEAEYKVKPEDANLNQWYGVCLLETNGDLNKAEECLLVASKKKIQESFLYLGVLYTKRYQFSLAAAAFDKYEASLKKKDDTARTKLADKKKDMARLSRMVSNTEDIQIIDSIIVDKDKFLSAYKLNPSSGSLDYYNKVFTSERHLDATVYFNERKTKMYYSKPDNKGTFELYQREKLLDDYSDERKLSANNFGLDGDINYPFVLTDGLTIYFAAKDGESLGGYDLFVSRFNLNNDTFLSPERLNMPFNSLYNDYMLAIDEEKGIGWFASDRYMPLGKVCIYTFIPNKVVKIIQSDDIEYLSERARVSSVKDSWIKGQDYSSLKASARQVSIEKKKPVRDFVFVINDSRTYYKLSDFKSRLASDNYSRVLELENELQKLSVLLDNLREAYSKSTENDKIKKTNEILSKERNLEQLQKDIQQLKIQTRNLEIDNL